MANALLLSLDDAEKVTTELVQEFCEADYKLTQTDKEWIRQELMQKCWIPDTKGSSWNKLDFLIGNISPVAIADQIMNDNLKSWCVFMQMEMNIALQQIKNDQK